LNELRGQKFESAGVRGTRKTSHAGEDPKGKFRYSGIFFIDWLKPKIT
jgi:hypothetical protein